MSRTPEGQDLLSFRLMSRLEAVLGSKARSGQQFDAWDAAYGPVGAEDVQQPPVGEERDGGRGVERRARRGA